VHTLVFERDAHPDQAPRFNPDRSYTIDITGHGMRALAAIDAMQRFDERLIRFKGIKAQGRVVEPYDAPGWTGSRGDILRALMSLVAERGNGLIDCHFETRVDAINVHAGELTVTGADGAAARHTADLIVGGDGAGSLVRRSMAQMLPDFHVESVHFDNHCTMIELDRVDGRLDPAYLHILSLHPMCVAGAINGAGGPADPRWFCMVGFNHKHIFASTDDLRELTDALISPDLITLPLDQVLDRLITPLVAFISTRAGFRALFLYAPQFGQLSSAQQEFEDLLTSRMTGLLLLRFPKTRPEELRRVVTVCFEIVKRLTGLAVASDPVDEIVIVELKTVLVSYLGARLGA
jgi:hypothetical protein